MKFEIIFGTVEGYFYDEDGENLKVVGEDLQKINKEMFEETEVYISGNLEQVNTIYNEDWGCPKGGEKCFKYTGTHNPEFIEEDKWKGAVIELAKSIKEFYKQSTLTVEFQESTLHYLK